MNSQPSEWDRLGAELRRRLFDPIKRVAFVCYFVVVLVVLGGMGCWIPLCRWWMLDDPGAVEQLPSALATFFLAILAGAMADVVLGDGSEEEEGESNRAGNAFRMLMLSAGLLGIPLAFVGLSEEPKWWTHASAILGTILSLFIWWVLNADNKKWLDSPYQELNVVGGSTEQPLPGSLAGLKN